MKHEKCLTFQGWIRYLSIRANEKIDSSDIEDHIANCPVCSDELNLMKGLYEALPEGRRNSREEAATIPQAYFELEEKYLRGELTEDEEQDLFDYLSTSSACLNEFAQAKANRTATFSNAEEHFFEELQSATVADRLTPYERRFFLAGKPGKRPESFLSRLWLHRPAIIMAVIVITLSAAGYFFYQKNQSVELLAFADSEYREALDEVGVTKDEIRPVGVSAYSPIGIDRSPKPKSLLREKHPHLFEAYERNPENAKLNHKLGTLYFYNNDLDEAEKHFQKAIAIDKSYAAVYNDLTLIDVERQDYKNALEHINTAIELNPALLEPRYNLAIVYKLQGDHQKTLEAWQAYLEFDTNPNSEFRAVAESEIGKM